MDDAQVRELQSVNPELASLFYEGTGAIADAADEEALEEVRVRLLGRKSALTQVLRSIPTLPAEQRPVVGRLGNLVRAELEKLADERRDALEASGAACLAGRGAHRRHAPRRAVPGRPRAPHQPDDARGRGHLHRPRLPHRGGARGRARLLQLHGAQHAARPPRRDSSTTRSGWSSSADDARGGRRRRPRRAAAHAHLSRAGAHHGVAAPAGLYRLSRQGLPARFRRHAHADVPPGRGPGRR